MGTQVDKRDTGKAPMHMLGCLYRPLQEVARVLAFGNKKYKSIFNYRTIDDGYARMSDAALRHLLARLDGEEKDPESGLDHLAHASCDLLMALWFTLTKP